MWDKIVEWFNGLSDGTKTLLTLYSVRVISVILLIIASTILIKWAVRLTKASLLKAKFDQTIAIFFSKLVRVLLLVVAFVFCLSIFGVETTSFAAVLAAAGFAIGLAFQGSLSNFSAGIMILVFRPYKIGDYVDLSGQEGIVTDIDMFNTLLDTFDNRRIIVPNGTVFGSTIKNNTHHPQRRVDVNVGVSYAADLDLTRSVLTEVAERLTQPFENRKSQVLLLNLGASSVDWVVRIWCNTPDYFQMKDKLITETKKALDLKGLAIPFPQMDVHLHNAQSPNAAAGIRPQLPTAQGSSDQP